MLQYVGTDVVRKQNPDYWVDFLIGFLKLFDDEWDIVLIPDARFPNEIDGMKNAFDTVSVLVRREFESQYSEDRQSHISETALDDYVGFDHIVECKTLEELRRHCMGFAKQIL